MRIAVLKFGGTSVADPEKIGRAAERAIAARRKGWSVAVVVSAPGEMTDELLALGRRVAREPAAREQDQLVATGEIVGVSLFAMACIARGGPAVSLTGRQAGVRTFGPHGGARVAAIATARIRRELKAGRIAVVAGFQGAGAEGDTFTLGRGGSDLSAVALASALGARRCEIYSDVKGVYTADPRIVSDARKLGRIGFGEMLELSCAGAQVMQSRSIELAARHGVPLHVRSAFHSQEGTWVVREVPMMEKTQVSSLALDKGSIRFSILDVPDRPGTAAAVLAELAAGGVPLDMILQAAPGAGGAALSFMIPHACAPQARKALREAARLLGGRVAEDERVAKVSAVGTGFRRAPAVAAAMFSALSRCRVNILMISASDLRISCVVDARHAETALRALHKAFGLAKKGYNVAGSCRGAESGLAAPGVSGAGVPPPRAMRSGRPDPRRKG